MTRETTGGQQQVTEIPRKCRWIAVEESKKKEQRREKKSVGKKIDN